MQYQKERELGICNFFNIGNCIVILCTYLFTMHISVSLFVDTGRLFIGYFREKLDPTYGYLQYVGMYLRDFQIVHAL